MTVEIASDQAELLIKELSTQNKLLLALDFDGTLADYKEDYNLAELHPIARVALRKLSELPNTFVSIVSGRALRDLISKFKDLEAVRLIGSHGYEFDLDQALTLSEIQLTALEKAQQLVRKTVESCPGTTIEIKAHGVVFHYRSLEIEPILEIEKLKQELLEIEQGIVREGKKVLEYCVVKTHKGDAVTKMIEQFNPTKTLFIGDDITDESAFQALGASDLSIKVGQDPTSAKWRLQTVEEVVQFLIRLSEARAEWIRNVPVSKIDQHLFLSDLRTLALVDNYGSLNWLCVPRLDSPPLFGALVGGPASGYFVVGNSKTGKQSYLKNSLIGQTKFDEITITDFFDCSRNRIYQRAGRSDLVRLIEGSGEVKIEFAPKYNFGRVPTRINQVEGGLKVECGQIRLTLVCSKINWHIEKEGSHDVARANLILNDERVPLILMIGTASASYRSVDNLLLETGEYWSKWVGKLTLPKNHSALVVTSALVLKGLCFAPTGAIAAAATTSLPESIGAGRNWDYRYCWPRDASLAASALLRLNSPEIAMRLLDWIIEIVFESQEKQFLAPLYTVAGRAVPPEAEITEAVGYLGSKPVRTGNLAADQLQLDALGPIAELMWKLAVFGESLTEEHLGLAEYLITLVRERWTEPDSGIWEVRGSEKNFVYSKLMCWYTVTCCTKVSEYLGIYREDWKNLAQLIREDIENKGFSEKEQSYVAAYGFDEADAALLWIVLSGFHPPDHPRSISTVNFIMKKLVHDGNVYRYHFNDSLFGNEGEFIICRAWLIEALIMCKQNEEAKVLFEQMLERIGELGLLSEQWDNARKIPLGNYPQAYSHLGLINVVCAMESLKEK